MDKQKTSKDQIKGDAPSSRVPPRPALPVNDIEKEIRRQLGWGLVGHLATKTT
jgi:hypothetical protein